MLELAGERRERVLSTNAVIGEPGATYYGLVNENRRYLHIEATPAPAPAVEEEHDSGIEADTPPAEEGRQSRASNISEADLSIEEFNLSDID